MNPFAIPQKYYAKEGYTSLMGLGYTAALAVVGLSVIEMVKNRDFGMEMLAVVVGGSLATWGYLKHSDIEY